MSGHFRTAGAITVAALIMIACLTPAACQRPAGNAQPLTWTDLFKPRPSLQVATAPADPADDDPLIPRQAPIATLQLSFDVLRTRVPRGAFSESGKIWNHLDEQVVPADLAATLQRNGLRIARGKMTSWAPIKALLDAERNVDCVQNAMTVGNGLPLTLELDAQPHDQTVFLYRRDGSLGGRTFTASMNLLRIEYLIPVTSPDSVVVEVMPEIRERPPEPALTPDGWRERPIVPPSRVFRELAARVQVGPDEFLAVGPSAAAHRAHTIGSLLLGQEIEGRRHECMFFITPRVIRRELPAGPDAWTVGAAGTLPRR